MSFLDLHQEVARHYQENHTKNLLNFYRVTTHFDKEDLYHMFMQHPDKIPFATEDGWNTIDREVIDRSVKFELKDGEFAYPLSSTDGKEHLKSSIPEISDEIYSRIYQWIEDRINQAGIILRPQATVYFPVGEYNYKKNEITYDPDNTDRRILLITLFVSYLYSIYYQSEESIDMEDKMDLDRNITVAVYWKLKDLGYDLGEYGLDSVAMCFSSYQEYLENDTQIEETISLLS